jgi:peroxiredoxin
LTSAAAPGIAKLFTDAFAKFDKDWVITFPPDVVRGTLQLQVGSVTISVPDGSSSEVDISAPVRAKYYPDPDTLFMPEPVHGEVRAAFTISVFTGPSRVSAPPPTESAIIDHIIVVDRPPPQLLIYPSSDDTKIQFVAAPGSGLTPTDEAGITTEVRKYLREDLDWLPVDLPYGFPFLDFKGLVGSGANPAIALPLQLSGAAPPPNGAQNITQSFIGSSGFGFAISAEYVNSIFPVDAIRQAIANDTVTISVDLWLGSVSATYHFQVTSGPTLTFTTGAIEIAIGIHAHTGSSLAPDFDIGVKQKVTLVLSAGQSITLERQGDPHVTKPWYIPSSSIVGPVKSAIDVQLNQLSQDTSPGSINGTLTDAKNQLVNGLQTFDAGASVTFSGVGVTTSGVALTGDIGSSIARHAPVVTIGETEQGTAFTALDSWIPAGQISAFVWTWVEHPVLWSAWQGVQKSVTDEHSFILPKPGGITDASQICLQIWGSQIEMSGLEIAVIGGTTCQVPQPPTTYGVPSWWGPMMIPFWRPDIPDTDPLKQGIAGHISVQASSPGDSQLQPNTLVYFVDTHRDHPLDSLCDALRQTHNGSTVDTIIVLANGTFDQTRREVENRLGLPFEGIPPLQFTEDSDDGWTRTFGVSKLPSMYLINARGEFVWSHVGEPDPATLAAVLDKYDAPSAEAAFRPLQLAVSPGDVAPDVTFTDGRNHYALQRLRGRDILLNFWQSWSAPCLTELQRLQDLTHAGPKAPFIVAFHGGADSKAVDDVRKSLALSFPVVQDPLQQIARRYGVRCWPTTVTIDPNGSVEHIQFGTAHDHEDLDSAAK